MAAPEWLMIARGLVGTKEVSGSGNNPVILAWADEIAHTYPEMATYCDLYRADATAWCGLFAGYVSTMAGIRPVFGKTDTDKFLWARAWHDEEWGYQLATPRLGCFVVMTREGGGHITLYENDSGSNIRCLGGNQSDQVNVATFPKSSVLAYMWPKEEGVPPEAPRRELELGASGVDVGYLQGTLGLPIDENFGPVTDAAVKGFQRGTGLEVDGIVGPMTWEKIDECARRMETGNDGISPERQEQIAELVLEHPIQKFVWEDRGRSPSGYVAGVAQVFALALTWLKAGDPIALEMAVGESGDGQTDVLSWYKPEFAKLGMDNSTGGPNTLRHLFAFMIGLGMRESSGRYYEGRDITATNTSADTTEAGCLQMSWNMRSASPSMGKLLEYFWGDPNGFLPTFSVGLTPTSAGLMNYGTGQGAAYQFLAKYSPSFCLLTGAIGLRKRCRHWGPVVRKEVELIQEADDVLLQVQRMMDSAPVEPEPEPEPVPEPDEAAVVQIETMGKVTVFVNGVPVP